MTTRPIAFFDVDYTLCNCYAGFPTTVELIRRGIVKKRRIPVALWYRLGAVFREGNIRKMYETAVSDMAGTHAEAVLQIGREIFAQRVHHQLYVDALDEVAAQRASGHAIVLISSGPDMLVNALAEFVAADASFSNGPVISESGILQSVVKEPLCYRDGKLVLAKRYAAERGVQLGDCRFYSDSSSDLPLLESVGHAIAVNPDRRLRRAARERRWRIADFRQTLGASPPARYADKVSMGALVGNG